MKNGFYDILLVIIKKINRKTPVKKAKKTFKRSITIPGSPGKTVKVNKSKLPDTIKANYSLTL